TKTEYGTNQTPGSGFWGVSKPFSVTAPDFPTSVVPTRLTGYGEIFPNSSKTVTPNTFCVPALAEVKLPIGSLMDGTTVLAFISSENGDPMMFCPLSSTCMESC